MVRLSPIRYPEAYALYREHNAFFPLIAAVLAGAQDGRGFVGQAARPNQVYVEHHFGFAQLFGAPVRDFERTLKDYFLFDRAFLSAKVRLYTPDFPSFLRGDQYEDLRSWRQRFTFDSHQNRLNNEIVRRYGKTENLEYVDSNNVELIQKAFGVVTRFWRNSIDFVKYSNAVIASVEGRPVAVCYAAAVADGRAEIDVLTLPEYRHLGLGKLVVRAFNQHCLAMGISPLWDCFTNNIASVSLCRSTGFCPLGDPYPFYTFSR